MKSLLFILSTLITLPYMLLAMAFVLLGKIASSGSLLKVLDILLQTFIWMMPWGILAMVLGTIAVAILGASEQYRIVGAIILGGVALLSLVILVALSSGRIGGGELLFLAPCIAVAAFCIWLVIAR